MVFWILNHSREEAQNLSESILHVKDGLRFCRICNNLSEADICRICSDVSRDAKTICVVETPKDLLAIERTGSYKGHYYVLLGNISPSEGRGPNDLNISPLMKRLEAKTIVEIVIATDPDTEGEMTALHITNLIKPFGIRLSRIGLGIPLGSTVEYSDLSTLTMSLNSRREL